MSAAEIEGHLRRFNIDSAISDPTVKIRGLDDYPVLKSFLAGSFSGTFSAILFQPLDLVKTRLQNTPQSSTCPRSCGMVTVLTTILKKEQLLALWTGITPSITRCVPGVGLYFSALHWLKSQTLVNENVNEPTPLQAVALGVAARTMSGAALIPITVIKTREFIIGVNVISGAWHVISRFQINYKAL
ncbi:mitochondrial glycine transporter-like [Ctenocephalides felis]|uniref:mitochondrial glycine transporter-like n=1 Tax=Ctenocephalides felis TaxID=7515 RepID=UPI000E6E4F25|nr:mitochondrial glycine transporter-like [Ctenocephalides felis]